jgi:hypothetical protein
MFFIAGFVLMCYSGRKSNATIENAQDVVYSPLSAGLSESVVGSSPSATISSSSPLGTRHTDAI